MSPFVYEEDMDDFCTDLLRFAMDHNYRPEVEWKRYKTKLSSFDVRHLVWSIAIRLGLGKGKVYSNDDCAFYIERRFASLCVTASGEPLSHSTLRNLTVTSNSDGVVLMCLCPFALKSYPPKQPKSQLSFIILTCSILSKSVSKSCFIHE